MQYFKKVGNYLKTKTEQVSQDKHEQNTASKLSEKEKLSLTKKSTVKNEEYFQILMLDILQNQNQQILKLNKQRKSKDAQIKQIYDDESQQVQKVQSMHTSQSGSNSAGYQNSQPFQDLLLEDQEHQQVQNMYIRDFIFVNKYQEGRQLTDNQWQQIIKNRDLSLSSIKNIYFSLFKGIKFQIRKDVWEVFANTSAMKKLTHKKYSELIDPDSIPKQDLIQIDKDVPRSMSVTNYTKQLRNILIGYCSFSKKTYTQGMNLIAGSLLTLLALQNDQQLKEFEVIQEQFEQRVFWVFIGVMVEKKWEEIFVRDFEGLKDKLQTLQLLMAEHTPSIYQRLIDFEWDLTIFSQFYITIMLYNSPINLSKIVLDLFFIQGQNIIHSLLIRMLKLTQDKILMMQDQCDMMNYLKKDMVLDCYNEIISDRSKANKLEDFKINFMKVGSQY